MPRDSMLCWYTHAALAVAHSAMTTRSPLPPPPPPRPFALSHTHPQQLHANLSDLISSLDTFRSHKVRDAFVGLVGVERAADVSLHNRCRLLQALNGPRTARSVDHHATHALFLATHGADLTHLKNGIDYVRER